jgi:predicted metal-dependent hydrolase
MITGLVSWSKSLLYLLATVFIILYFVRIINSIFDLHIIGCKEMELDYEVVRSKKRKKTISLQVRANGTAVVYVPHRTPIPEIDKFVREKERWISRKIRENGERQKEIKAKKYVTGEMFFFLGEPYPLKIEAAIDGYEKLAFCCGQFVLASDKVSQGRELFVDWYRKSAQRYIGERVDHYSQTLKLIPRGIKISNARCRWGSCSQDNHLHISWRLIMAPCSVIDYLVVHELAHTQEKNHSERFWDIVGNTITDYKKQRVWLKDNGHTLDI